MAPHQYICGHQDSVLKSHSWRTVENSAGYLLPFLTRDDLNILDVGCGPGTITLDLAALVPKGRVVGIDMSAEVIEKAKAEATRRGITNATFFVGDVYSLTSYDTDERGGFDVAHAHQVLQHVQEPLRAMQSMYSAIKPGGLLATREVVWSAMQWYPRIPGLNEWCREWIKVSKSNGCDPDAGTALLSLSLKTGFKRDQITATAGQWSFSTLEEREWWSNLWADRLQTSSFAKQFLEKGHGTQEDLERWAADTLEWGKAEDAWFGCLHGEVVCRK